MQFNKIKPGDEAYAVIDAALNDTSEDRTDYNIVAKAYNDLKPGEGTSFEFPKAKFPSLKKQLEKRGLIVGVDMQIKHVLDGAAEATETEAAVEGTETVILRRLTEKDAQILVITVANRRRKKKGTEAPASDGTPASDGDGANAAGNDPAPAATDAKPAAPAGKANPPKAGGKK